jgi:uncharacterized membrane protein
MMPSTLRLMRAGIFLILMVLCGQIVAAQTITTAQTVTTIDIRENGTAFWTLEEQKPLTTQSEIIEWNLMVNESDTNMSRKNIEDFKDKINVSLEMAKNYSNRSMTIENFNISYDIAGTLPSAYGIIRYNFEWNNFSRINSSEISIGDVFSEELLGVPSVKNVLVIIFPKGYILKNSTPKPDKADDNRLIWDGTMYSTFNKGEPSLVLSKIVVTHETLPAVQHIWRNILPLLALVILIFVGIFIFWIKKRPMRKRQTDAADIHGLKISENKTEPIAENIELTEKKESQSEAENNEEEDTELTPNTGDLTPEYLREILSDEEMIEKYLIKIGGQAYQSEIVKESGLSKSKISIVLAKMKEEGRILKIRKGKENIIRLIPKT